MQMNGAGESHTPFSQFADQQKISETLKDRSQAASPATVTSIIVLPTHSNKKCLKTYLREKLFAANHDIRSVLYKTLAKRVDCNEDMFNRQMYELFVAENFPGADVSDFDKLRLPDFAADSALPLFCLNSAGKSSLFKILACIEHHFPHITHSLMLPVATIMFLVYDDDPAQVFTHVCRLIFSNMKHCQYLDLTHSESAASAKVLKALSQRYTPASYKSLLNMTPNPDQVYREWIKCLFHGLPLAFVVVLFDMFLIDGYKALYRVSLAIMKFYRKVGVSNRDNIVDAVFQFVKDIEQKVTPALLFRKAFSFKLPSSKEIAKLHRTMSLRSPTSEVQRHTRNPWHYLRRVRDIRSDIASETLLSNLYCWLPENVTLLKPLLIFSTNKNGYSQQMFFSCCGDRAPMILLIRTVNNEVIGAYLPSAWTNKSKPKGFYGTGETFLFTLLPETQIYRWVAAPETDTLRESTDSETALSIASGDDDTPPPSTTRMSEPHSATVHGPNHAKSSITSSLPRITAIKISDKQQSHCTTSGVSLPPINSPVHSLDAVESATCPKSPLTLPPIIGGVPKWESYLRDDAVAPSVSTTSHCQSNTSLFMMCDEQGLTVGGGGGGVGLFVDASLNRGTSQRCATFNNTPLVSGGSFVCSVVEVIGFDPE